MSRQVIQASLLILALTGTDAYALGLGGLRTESALNQPFVGEIDLFDVKPDELDTVKATLATADAFAKSGIERYHFLTQLAFAPRMSERGGAVIRITSREPIREPFMDFLVEVVWPAGQLVKEFTVLLDPPSTSERPAPAVRPPAIADRRPAGPSSSTPSSALRSGAATPRSEAADRTPSPPARRPPSGPDGFPLYLGPVRFGTGLLRLARAGQPMGATRAQTALALYRNNQEAFINGDIDRLIAGKTLVIPTRAELFALDDAVAAQELQAALQGESVRRAPITDVARIDEAAATEGARLRIAGAAAGAVPGTVEVPSAGSAPDPDEDTAEPSGGTPSPGTDLEQELLLVMEASESSRQETEELRGRIRELETQLADIQTLLQLRNTELARLQGGAPGESTETTTGGARPETKPDLVVAEAEAADAAGSGPIPETPSDAAGAAPSAETPAVAAAAPEPLPVAEPSLVEGEAGTAPPVAAEMEETEPAAASAWHVYLLPLAGFAGVTALGVVAFSLVSARRRRKQEESADEWSIDSAVVDFQEPEPPFPEPSPAGVDTRTPADANLAARSESVPAPKEHEPEIDAGLPTPSSQLASFAYFETETEEADVLSEADIYIAYGRYKEAEELLKRELRRSPERLDVRFKLAEVYAGSENPQALRDLMQQLKACGADTVEPARWQRLSAIAAVVEQGGVWDPGATLPITEATGVAGGESRLDLDALHGAADSSLGQARGAGDASFVLDISDVESAPRAEPAPTAASAAVPSAATSGEDLPLSLDDSALDTPADLPDLSGPDDARDGTAKLPDGDLILTLDDLRDSRDLDLDAFLDAESRPLDSPAAEREWSLPRLDLPTMPAASGTSAVSRNEEAPVDRLGAPDDAFSGQWAMDSGIWDENATKLDLARAYIDMDDVASAREILQEVIADGREEQRSEARALLRTLA
jgi:pilus assembly protein FimV